MHLCPHKVDDYYHKMVGKRRGGTYSDILLAKTGG